MGGNLLQTKMMPLQSNNIYNQRPSITSQIRGIVMAVLLLAATAFNLFSQSPERPDSLTAVPRATHAVPHIHRPQLPDSIAMAAEVPGGDDIAVTHFDFDDGVFIEQSSDTVPVVNVNDEWVRREVEFVPDPTRAVWLSALCPGLGQVYNRRYWKLPLVIGGYLGLAYATSWNNTMLSDYTRAYADITDNDPNTNSYMDFFHGNIKEENLDKTWLKNVLKSRKDYFRRNRDLCIIGMVGVYLLAMVDAYVDASLSHFDISPQLSMDVAPALIQDTRGQLPGVGLQWALCF